MNVGDKEAHAPQVHVVQLLYFAGFAVAMTLPAHLPSILLPLVRWRLLVAAVLLIPAMLLTIHKFTIAHPYLVADNRHYTFYLWKNILNRHPLVRYSLAPVYALCCLSLANKLGAFSGSQARALWLLGLTVCTAAVLVPAGLIELRYFTVSESMCTTF